MTERHATLRADVTRFIRSLAIAAAVLALAPAVAAPGCRKKTAPRMEANAVPESWVVDDAAYRVTSSYYEYGPDNVVVYVVRYPVPKGTSENNLDKDGAGILAWPLIKYAYNNKTYARAKIPPQKGSAPPQINIAVDLLSSDASRVLFRHEVPAGK
jgi:hypothetical protein